MAAVVSSPEVHELPDLQLPLCYMCASFVISLVLVKGVSPLFSPLLYPSYTLLARAKQLDWDTRVASNVHAILVCVLLYFIFVYEESMYTNLAWGDSLLARLTCAIVVGYLTADMAVILVHWKELGDFAYIVHHIASITPYVFILRYGVMPFFGMYRLLAEASTPFVNKRWILDTLQVPRTSKAFFLNGVTMAATFCACRILTIPYYYYKLLSLPYTDQYYETRTWPFVWIAFWSCFVLDCLNVKWMVKIFRGMLKVLRLSKEATDKNENKVKEN